MYWLGIDAGTTFTAAAIAAESGPPTMVLLGPDRASIQSVAHLRDEELSVGPVAVSRGDADPAELITAFKRALGQGSMLIPDGREIEPDVVLTELLRWTNARVIQTQGGPPLATAVSYPANWSPNKQIVFREVVDRAGLINPSIISDPEAAALAHTLDYPVDDGSLIAVYDLGGGTFDSALLRRRDTGFMTEGPPSGIDHLGGLDLDQAMFDYVIREAGVDLSQLDETDIAVRRALHQLRRRTTAAKLALSVDDSTSVAVALAGVDTYVPLSRESLENLARPMVQQSIDALQRGMRVAQVEPADLATILLVGGSSRLPLVEQMLAEQLGTSVIVSADPKNVIARGAALHARNQADRSSTSAAATSTSESNATTIVAPVVPAAELLPVESLPAESLPEPPPPPAESLPSDSLPEPPPPPVEPLPDPPPSPEPAPVEAPAAQTSAANDTVIVAQEPPAASVHQSLQGSGSAPPPRQPPPAPLGDNSGGNKRRRRMLIVVGLLAIAGAIAATTLFVFSAQDADAASQIFAEPISSVGIDPFTPDLVAPSDELDAPVGDLADFVGTIDLVPVPRLAGADGALDDDRVVNTSGDSVGLYGGTEQLEVCNTQLLIDFLATNPDKAQAWADVHRIQRSQIAEFVNGLTMVVLTRDALVTNHGFRDGRANPIQSLLQAGTAVLVDERGVPRVRCKCGNPLVAPMALAEEVEVVGDQWPGLELGQAVAISPSPSRLTEFTLTDLNDGSELVAVAGAAPQAPAFQPTAVSESDESESALAAPDPTTEPTNAPVPIAPSTPEPTAPAPSATPIPPTAVPPTPIPPTAVPATAVPAPPTPTPTPSPVPVPPTPAPPPRSEVTLTGQGSISANTSFTGFPASFAVDNDVSTSWFSTGPGAGPSVFTWSGPRTELTQVSFIGNASHATPEFRSGFGFSSVSIEVFDGATSVYSSTGSGQGWQWEPDVEGDRVVLTFTGHEDPTCGGFSELIVKGLA